MSGLHEGGKGGDLRVSLSLAGGVWSSLVAGICRRWCRRRQRGSTEAMYRFRKHWPVYTGLEKHTALCHLITRPHGPRWGGPNAILFDPPLAAIRSLGADTARLTGKFSDYHLSSPVEFYSTFAKSLVSVLG